jgi:hypothetical protein
MGFRWPNQLLIRCDRFRGDGAAFHEKYQRHHQHDGKGEYPEHIQIRKNGGLLV